MRTAKTLAAAALALVLAAACGSTGIGDILGGGTGTNQSYDIRGTVDSIDLNSRSLYLTNVSGYSNNLNTGGTSGNTVRVYFDNDTTVTYQGRTYRPQDLERGDEVMIRANSSGGTLVADSMTVTYNAQGAMTSGSGSTIPSGSVIHGTVRSIDTYNRTLTIDRGFGSNVVISYSANTPVYFNNRTYAVSSLEVGDEIDIRTSNASGSNIGASEITVTRSISGTSGSTSSGVSTIRGTVRSVDTYNRTITLENSSWISGFQSSTSGNLMTIRYDTSTRVDYQGQLHPITNLERGDVIDVQVSSTSNLLAQRIFLVRDVNSF
jgi:Domain of unknown function (DUF5666)